MEPDSPLEAQGAGASHLNIIQMYFEQAWTSVLHAACIMVLCPTFAKSWSAWFLLAGARLPHTVNLLGGLSKLWISNEHLTDSEAFATFQAFCIFSSYSLTIFLFRASYFIYNCVAYLFTYMVYVYTDALRACVVVLITLTFFVVLWRIGILVVMVFLLDNALKITRFFQVSTSTIVHRGFIAWNSCCTIYLESSVVKIFERSMNQAILWTFGLPRFHQRPLFVYPPLMHHQRKIRLLLIKKRVPFLELDMELLSHSLDSEISYEAISYVWGLKRQKEMPVMLDGGRFGVPENVYSILRRRSSFFASRLVWIDTICINQNNNHEKADQVRMMKDIYAKASRVFVCLGESPNAWLAVTMLNELVLMKSLLTPKALGDQIVGMTSGFDMDEMLKLRVVALLELLHNPWFERVWVFQEVTVARAVTILYGSRKIHWDFLANFAYVLLAGETAEILSIFQYADSTDRPFPVAPTQSALMNGYRDLFRQGRSVALYEMLRKLSALRATVPRDKIFAIIGLTDSSAELTDLIDYTSPTADILLAVATHFRTKGQLAEVLHFAGIGWERIETSIPSWVAEWTISRNPTTLAKSFNGNPYKYQAAKNKLYKTSEGKSEKHVKLRGQFIDNIREVGELLEIPDRRGVSSIAISAHQYVEPMLTWVLESQKFIQRYAPDPYHNQQPLSEAFWRTLIGDRTLSERPAPAKYGEHFEKLRELLDLIKSSKGQLDSPINLAEFIERASSQFSDLKTLRDFIRDMSRVASLCGQPSFPRRLGVINNGYIIVVPKFTRKDDIICLIFGCEVPFVLRPVSDTSSGNEGCVELVGECYVHGMMDGEALGLGYESEDYEIV